jgi:hypothetical protein
MLVRTLWVIIIAAVVATGCGGASDEAASTPTDGRRTPSPSAGATASPSPVAVPPKPAALDDYADAVTRYLDAAGPSVLGEECLRDLIEDWELPTEGDTWPCLAGNADSDPDEEVALILTAEDDEQPDLLLRQVVVFDPAADGFQVAYASEPTMTSQVVPAYPALLALSDINGDGNGELVYTETDCGAHTCTTTAHIITGTSTGFRSISGEGLSMATADVYLSDDDGDGVFDLVMEGGLIGSVGAGPQRERAEVYEWAGREYALAQTTYAPTDNLYLRILEADETFAEERYQDALALYEDALNDESLELWKEEMDAVEDERAEVNPYLLFRIALCKTALGVPPAEPIAIMDRAVVDYPFSVHTGLVRVFLDSYLARGDLSVSCAAARDHAMAHIDELTSIWDYGYANPAFDPLAVCPF